MESSRRVHNGNARIQTHHSEASSAIVFNLQPPLRVGVSVSRPGTPNFTIRHALRGRKWE